MLWTIISCLAMPLTSEIIGTEAAGTDIGATAKPSIIAGQIGADKSRSRARISSHSTVSPSFFYYST